MKTQNNFINELNKQSGDTIPGIQPDSGKAVRPDDSITKGLPDTDKVD